MSLSNDGQDRVSTARGYLDASVRARPNLTIRTGVNVVALTRDGRRITGVEIDEGGQRRRVVGRRTILTAGALHSPAFLMRAGIGRSGELGDLGIDVISNLAGVGRNLQEHPGISISAFLKPRARMGRTTRRHMLFGLRFSSGLPDSPPSDMYMAVIARSAWHPIGRQIGSLITWLNKVHSRGWVRLATKDPYNEPVVALNFLSDTRDTDRLVAAVRLMASILAHPELAKLVEHPSPSSYSRFARSLGRYSLGNYLMTAPVALGLDLLPFLRDRFFRTFLSNGMSLAEIIADDDALRGFIEENAIAQWHVSGTCRMGQAGDPDAVVDPLTMAVHGVEGLHVADASVMPSVPRANTNIPTIMIAERAADLIIAAEAAERAGYRVSGALRLPA